MLWFRPGEAKHDDERQIADRVGGDVFLGIIGLAGLERRAQTPPARPMPPAAPHAAGRSRRTRTR